MKTMIICIGNTDNKLTQQGWYSFCNDINHTIEQYPHTLHFFGGPPTHSPYQNVLWMLEIREEYIEKLKREIKEVRETFGQDSVFVMVSDGEFV